MIGDRIFATGAMTVVVSVAVYAAMSVAFVVLTVVHRPTPGAGVMAIPLATFLLGLVIMAAGWAVSEYEAKGTPFHDVRERRRR